MNLDRLTQAEKREFISLLEERERRSARRKLLSYYPDTGSLRRELYPKHLAFFRAGTEHRERLMLAANRVGKTEGMGGYETALHLTGRYPAWWEGRRFDRPVRWWAAGKTNETTRDIIQGKLFGIVSRSSSTKVVSGTGLIPGDDIQSITWKQGVNDLIDTAQITHVSGGTSTLGLKSYQQGRGSFEGTEQDGIWLDEEPPLDVYAECIIRTMTTDGMLMLTFTPLEGMSEVVSTFLVNGQLPGQPA
jgi:phage terminase large subunit-like protein